MISKLFRLRSSLFKQSFRQAFNLSRFFSETATNSDFDIRNKQREGRSIYLDFGATTPLDFRVLDKMLPYLTQLYGNPHSRSHMYGWETESAVEKGREHIANLINANSKEIIFTSGATESNNLALKGLASFYGQTKKKHFITTQIEHKCVLDTFRNLEDKGFEVTYLKVDTLGYINLKDLEEAIRPDTIGVSIMTTNNEIGVVQNIKEIGHLCRSRKVFFHTDAAQAVGKIPIDVEDCKIDLLSISAHKFYGPKGVGALYVRRKPRVKLLPMINGGGQERGLRSGTLAPHNCVGFGEACRIAAIDMEKDSKHIKHLANKFKAGLTAIPLVHVNGDLDKGYPGIFNCSFEFVEGES